MVKDAIGKESMWVCFSLGPTFVTVSRCLGFGCCYCIASQISQGPSAVDSSWPIIAALPVPGALSPWQQVPGWVFRATPGSFDGGACRKPRCCVSYRLEPNPTIGLLCAASPFWYRCLNTPPRRTLPPLDLLLVPAQPWRPTRRLGFLAHCTLSHPPSPVELRKTKEGRGWFSCPTNID